MSVERGPACEEVSLAATLSLCHVSIAGAPPTVRREVSGGLIFLVRIFLTARPTLTYRYADSIILLSSGGFVGISLHRRKDRGRSRGELQFAWVRLGTD